MLELIATILITVFGLFQLPDIFKNENIADCIIMLLVWVFAIINLGCFLINGNTLIHYIF